MDLPGLDRLVGVCHSLRLEFVAEPPWSAPAEVPPRNPAFDPLLAAVYSRWSRASFATDVHGLVLAGNDNSEYNLEEQNTWWRENHQAQVPLPLFIFGGEPLLAHSYATVPLLADPQGRQPVVHVNTYELDGPSILPIASNVDRLFDTYSRFLEGAAATPEFQKDRSVPLTFPWDVPHVLARDTPLVELIRAGRLEPLLPQDSSIRDWLANILALAAQG